MNKILDSDDEIQNKVTKYCNENNIEINEENLFDDKKNFYKYLINYDSNFYYNNVEIFKTKIKLGKKALVDFIISKMITGSINFNCEKYDKLESIKKFCSKRIKYIISREIKIYVGIMNYKNFDENNDITETTFYTDTNLIIKYTKSNISYEPVEYINLIVNDKSYEIVYYKYSKITITNINNQIINYINPRIYLDYLLFDDETLLDKEKECDKINQQLMKIQI